MYNGNKWKNTFDWYKYWYGTRTDLKVATQHENYTGAIKLWKLIHGYYTEYSDVKYLDFRLKI